jgi:transcriptional regulator with XRE-family HTH domain
MSQRYSENEIRTIFGRRLREARTKSERTQEALAAEINMSVDMIGRLERGTAQPSFETIARLSTALSIHPAFLFGGDVETTTLQYSSETAALIDRIRTLPDEDKRRVSSAIDLIVR